MRNNQVHNTGGCDAGSAFAMESLERREFLSVSLAHSTKAPVVPAPLAHAAVVVAKKAAPAAPAKVTAPVKPAPAKPVKATVPVTPAPKPIFTTGIVYPSLLGSWSGTYVSSLPGATRANFSMNLTSQKNGAASGTITLGGLGAVSGSMKTTFEIDAAGNVLLYLPTPSGQVSIVAGLSANGKQIVGRWCTHVGTTFTVGTFVLNKA